MKRDLPSLVVHFIYLFIFILVFLTFPVSVYASFGFSKNPTAIFSPDPNNWDYNHVKVPNILKNGIVYKMWYTGNGSNGWSIGYADSENGISFNNRAPTPVVPPGTTDQLEKETADFSIIHQPNIYKIWYTSINSGSNPYITRYATSIDGITWTKHPTAVLTGTPDTWDSVGTLRGKSVVYDGTTYHMWYAGADARLPWGTSWKIGYATSPDGIEWTKQNNGQPVITPTESWEKINVSYPFVLLRNGVYHMWYSTGPEDLPDEIVYAYSFDGITWTKPADYNPVISRGPDAWDSYHAISPYILIDGDQLKMWYSGYGIFSATNPNDLRWQIGYATAPLSNLPGAPAVPTSTPTSTPTPTPTPTPAQIKKVIFIPGSTASWNLDALINCKKDNYKGNWSLLGPAKQIYNPLIQSLTDAGWQVRIFPYDWRAIIPSHAGTLKSLISSIGAPVDIVGHSMGGLVGRAYLEQEQTASGVEKFMTVGSPHSGAVFLYPAWSAGEIPKGDPMWRFMLTLIEKRCAAKTHNDRLAIQQYFPGLQNLLPTFNYLTDNATNAIKPVTSMLEQNNWLPTSFASPFFGTTIGTLSGSGQTTIHGYRVANPSFKDLNLGNWLDGKPVSTITSPEGDGAVLSASASLTGADNRSIAGTHTAIVSSDAGISQILDFLNNTQVLMRMNTIQTQNKPHKPESPRVSSSLYIIADPADFWLVGRHGKITKSDEGIIALTNPSNEEYALVIRPKSNETTVIISQELGDDKFFYKEYTLKNRLPKVRMIHFDPKHPREDILK